MKECLVTRLRTSVNDDSLLKLGELRYKTNGYPVMPGSTESSPITLTILTPGVTFVKNGQNTMTGHNFSNSSTSDTYTATSGPCEISLESKYALTAFRDDRSASAFTSPISLDDFKYCEGLSSIKLTRAFGSLSSLKDKNMEIVSLIDSFNSDGSTIEGSVDDIPASGLTSFYLQSINPNLGGDVSRIAGGAGLNEFSIECSNSNSFYGNLDEAFKKSLAIVLPKSSTIGNLSLIGITGRLFTLNGTYTWPTSTSMSTERTVPSIIGNVNLGDDLDNCLINLAACTNFNNVYRKSLALKGNKTSASDEAVQTLKSNGWSVTIN